MASSPFRKTYHPVLEVSEIEDIETQAIYLQYQCDRNDESADYKNDILDLAASVKLLVAHSKFLVEKCESRVSDRFSNL